VINVLVVYALFVLVQYLMRRFSLGIRSHHHA